MFTPPPQSEADAVRVIIGHYDPLEMLMAYYMQTSEGQPYNVMLFFSQYQTIDEYMKCNSAAAVAGQIDWWTRTRIYNARESLQGSHTGNYQCYFTAHRDSWRQEAVDRNDPEFWQCKLDRIDDGWQFLGIWEDEGIDWCNYEPSHEEIADEMTEMEGYWEEGFDDDMQERFEAIKNHPKFEALAKELNFYAKERRALAEAQERQHA